MDLTSESRHHIKHVADEALKQLEGIAATANSKLHDGRTLGFDSLASINTMTSSSAVRLGIPVEETVAVRHGGAAELTRCLEGDVRAVVVAEDSTDLHVQVRELIAEAVSMPRRTAEIDDAIDRIVLHPVLGLVLLAAIMFLIFQAVFSWAEPLMEAIEIGIAHLGTWVGSALTSMPMLQSLVVDGIFAGIGSVLVFLPQILILFLFILALEESGYICRVRHSCLIDSCSAPA